MRALDYKKLILDIQNWIKQYVKSAKGDGLILGLSGGIDSCVTAALCVNALGKEKVIGLNIPIESISQDYKDAELISELLQIKFLKIDLTDTFTAMLKAVSPDIDRKKMALANLKPRLRMTILYFIGQSLGRYLVTGTSNRTEIAIGYFTKYGDGAADFEPIASIYKCEVRELARILKIPEKIIMKPPSAGLWENQTTEGEIGIEYNTLDEIVYRIDNYL
ncbi:MAG TPA: NAD(+) synthase, partial [Candidatus Lokiarchaeia archaeon]